MIVKALRKKKMRLSLVRGSSLKQKPERMGTGMSELGDVFNAMKKDKQERRAKRMKRVHSCLEDFDGKCTKRGFRLVVKNHGHHWIVKTTEATFEWFPSSGKLVINQQWEKVRRAYSTDDVWRIIEHFKKGEAS